MGRKKIVDRANENAWLSILPIFLLYLVDAHNYDESDILEFMNWFNETNEWIDGDPSKLMQIAKEIEERTGCVLKW